MNQFIMLQLFSRHVTDPPIESSYCSVVLLQSLRMMMFIGKLNDFEMCLGDIDNEYLESGYDEKVTFEAGPEFGGKAGHIALGNIENYKTVFCKPTSFMNLSGHAFLPVMSYYKIERSQLIVIHDDIDLEFCKVVRYCEGSYILVLRV
jgi:hypothetical protein